MRYYRIPGQDRPYFLSEDHAAQLQATPWEAEDRPARNASTGDWQAYAVTQGMDPDVAGAMTRAQIIATYDREE